MIGQGNVFAGITCTVTALNVMYLTEMHKEFNERWPKFHIFHNIANLPSWYNPNVFPNEMKEDIVKPLREGLENNVFKTDHAISEITGIINHSIAPREDVIRPYGNQPTDTIENEIAVRWNMFRKQVVAGDEYRDEDFRDVFPELWEIVKEDFFYSKLYERAKADPMYGAIDKGTFI
jgi:hypothetical protein